MIKAFSWNVNGIRAIIRRGDLQKFIAEFSPDVLAMQETKIVESQLADLKLPELFPDYQMFWSFAKKKGYAGTAVWVKKGLESGKVILKKSDCLQDKYGDACREGRLTAVEIDKTLFVSIYVPNGKEDLSRIPLRVKYDTHINNTFKPYAKVLLMGDFNVANEPIDVANPGQKKGKHGFTIEERDSFKSYIAAGFHDIWRDENPEKVQYTWWSFRVKERGLNGWRIDYALTKGIKARDAKIYSEIYGSDHCPISVEVESGS